MLPRKLKNHYSSNSGTHSHHCNQMRRKEIWAWPSSGSGTRLSKSGAVSTLNIRNWLYRFFEVSGINFGTEDVNLLVQMGILTRIIRSVEETNRRSLSGYKRRSRQVSTHTSPTCSRIKRKMPSFSNNLQERSTRFWLLRCTRRRDSNGRLCFCPSLAHMRFPVPSRRHGSSFPDSIAKRYGTSETDERRLFYVALTRAKEQLILTSFENRGKISQFLKQDSGGLQLIEPTKSVKQIAYRKGKQVSAASEMLRGSV